MNEPKTCPFCDGEATRIAAQQRDDGTYYPARCGCYKCGIWRYGESNYGHGGFATKEDLEASMEQAVLKWNTRTEQTAERGECEIVGITTGDLMYPDYTTKWYELSCGHSLTLKHSELPNYCPICGNKTRVTRFSTSERVGE